MGSRLSGSNRFLLNHGQTFNTPKSQRWPAIFWPGYTAATLFKRHRAASCSFKMISFANINKQYGKQLLFVDASVQLNPGEKVGLVGPNGAGKPTLFRMVVGEETPDEGAVSVPKKLTIGYFRQDVEEMQGRSVLDEAIAGSGRELTDPAFPLRPDGNSQWSS